jgi:c-di-GMP-binding flagellar brake protein YcgR
MSDISSFSIQNPKQIVNYLSLLFKKKYLIRARFGIHNESYITTLLGIDEKNNTLILDYGPKESLNYHILTSGRITFETEYKGIKVSFSGSALKKIIYKGEPAFSAPIPKTLFWMERREYYRVKMPLSKLSYCQLILENKPPFYFKIYDISLSGFSMLNDYKETFDQMIPGTLFTQCKLVLSDAGEGKVSEDAVSCDIRYNYIINPGKLQKTQKVGCKLIKITPSIEEVIQRYMQQIQREDLQKDFHFF